MLAETETPPCLQLRADTWLAPWTGPLSGVVAAVAPPSLSMHEWSIRVFATDIPGQGV